MAAVLPFAAPERPKPRTYEDAAREQRAAQELAEIDRTVRERCAAIWEACDRVGRGDDASTLMRENVAPDLVEARLGVNVRRLPRD